MAAGRQRSKPVVLEDPTAIKALAHPARLAVIDDLFGGAELTATEAARIAGVTPSAMSYHLRALEKAGIIERSDASGDGRERPWRARGNRLQIGPSTPAKSRDAPESEIAAALAAGAVASAVLDGVRRDLQTWLQTHADDPDARWRELGTLSTTMVWLTADEAEQIQRAQEEILEKARGRTAGNRPEGSRRVHVLSIVYPRGQDAAP